MRNGILNLLLYTGIVDEMLPITLFDTVDVRLRLLIHFHFQGPERNIE